MRFKKGSKVEVLSESDLLSPYWRTAEIITGNGHNYTVRYEGYMSSNREAMVERLPRKAIRPCPPPVEVFGNWIPGDFVEVLDDFSWKIAKVVKVLGNNYFSIRLIGSLHEFEVYKFDIRVRQSWEDGIWIVIGKAPRNYEDDKRKEKPTLKFVLNSSSKIQQTNTRMNLCLKDNCIDVKNNFNFQDSHIVSSKTLKRGSPYCYSRVEPYEGPTKKLRLMNRLHEEIAANPTSLPEKVDPIPSPQKMLSERYLHTGFNNRTTGFTEMDVERGNENGKVGCSLTEMDVERGNENGKVGCSLTVSLAPSDADRCTSSVGSCSITSNTPYRLPGHFSTGPDEDREGNISDAESCCWGEYEEGNCLIPEKEDAAEEIHRLELHAYRCTLEALHASGPLSWERETLVTNLRLSLNISNDEHLMEIRNLISSDTSIPVC